MMMNLAKETEIRNSINIKATTPDGTAYIIIDEDYPGKINRVYFNVGRSGTSVNAWAHCVAELVTELLHDGKELNDVINILSNITSQRSTRSINGIECRSGPDALFIALMKYRAMIPKPIESFNNRRPAKFKRTRL